jgi:DNA-binding response OmpR family regulator
MKPRVLLIDDEDDLRSTLKEMLELNGWSVECATNGNEGYKKTLESPFDIIISDVRMPIASGVDFLKLLESEYKIKTPILMASAYSDFDENSLKELGARKLLAKPINMTQLMEQMYLQIENN